MKGGGGRGLTGRNLRPKSADEKSSGRSLWKVFHNFFAPPPSPLPPPLQIKLGGPIAVNCSGILNN